jgi:hypothetical protein
MFDKSKFQSAILLNVRQFDSSKILQFENMAIRTFKIR